MAFDKANLHVVYQGGDCKSWVYERTDTLQAIASSTATEYFTTPSTVAGRDSLITQGSTKGMFRPNDRIYVQAGDVRANCFVSSISGTNSSVITLGVLGQSYGEIAVSTGTLLPYGFYHSTAASGQISILAMPYTAGQVVNFFNSVSTSRYSPV